MSLEDNKENVAEKLSDFDILKNWQTNFQSQHGHQPSKNDFKTAPVEVQEAGARYQKSKKSADTTLTPKIQNISLKSDLNFSLKKTGPKKSNLALKIANKRKNTENPENVATQSANAISLPADPSSASKNSSDPQNLDPTESFPEAEPFETLPAAKKSKKMTFTSSNFGLSDNLDQYEKQVEAESKTSLDLNAVSPISDLSSVAISPFDLNAVREANLKSPKKSRPNMVNKSQLFNDLKKNMSPSGHKFNVDSPLIGEDPTENQSPQTSKINFFEKRKLEQKSSLKTSQTLEKMADKVDKAVPISQNFLKLDLKKKVFQKGGNNAKKLQKQVYKEKLNKKFGGSLSKKSGGSSFNAGNASGKYVNSKWGNTTEQKCYNCGLPGHFSKDCTQKKNAKFDQKILDNLKSEFKAAEIEKINVEIDQILEKMDKDKYENFECETEISISENRKLVQKVTSGSVVFSDAEIYSCLQNNFGFENFREGQLEAIQAILQARRNTLVVLATGQGKSLTFQIPALLLYRKYKFLTLVISPLVSLMDDQVKNLPKALPACRINSSMNEKQKDKVMSDLAASKYAMLYISPEAVNSWCSNPDSQFLRDLPPIGLAVIDEIHCLSQWSHSFRPSYLRICAILKRLHIPVLMGLTATATKDTCNDNCSYFCSYRLYFLGLHF